MLVSVFFAVLWSVSVLVAERSIWWCSNGLGVVSGTRGPDVLCDGGIGLRVSTRIYG